MGLETRLLNRRERAGRVALPVPVLTDRDGFARPGTDNGPVEPAALSEHLGVAGARLHSARDDTVGPVLCILVRPVAPQGTLHVVRHHAAVPDVEQPGELELPVAERAPHASRPAGIRVGEDALVRVGDREARRVDIHRAPRSAGAGCADRTTQKGRI